MMFLHLTMFKYLAYLVQEFHSCKRAVEKNSVIRLSHSYGFHLFYFKRPKAIFVTVNSEWLKDKEKLRKHTKIKRV